MIWSRFRAPLGDAETASREKHEQRQRTDNRARAGATPGRAGSREPGLPAARRLRPSRDSRRPGDAVSTVGASTPPRSSLARGRCRSSAARTAGCAHPASLDAASTRAPDLPPVRVDAPAPRVAPRPTAAATSDRGHQHWTWRSAPRRRAYGSVVRSSSSDESGTRRRPSVAPESASGVGAGSGGRLGDRRRRAGRRLGRGAREQAGPVRAAPRAPAEVWGQPAAEAATSGST